MSTKKKARKYKYYYRYIENLSISTEYYFGCNEDLGGSWISKVSHGKLDHTIVSLWLSLMPRTNYRYATLVNDILYREIIFIDTLNL